MKNENGICEKIIEMINAKVKDKKLPVSVTISTDDGAWFQDHLEDCLKKLEKVGKLKITNSEKKLVRNKDPMSINPHFGIIVFSLDIKHPVGKNDCYNLFCGDFVFNTITGVAQYRKQARFKDGSKQYTLLYHFLNNPNKRSDYKEIAELVGFSWNYENHKNPSIKRKINNLLRDIKEKLGLREKDKILEAVNGYRLNCD